MCFILNISGSAAVRADSIKWGKTELAFISAQWISAVNTQGRGQGFGCGGAEGGAKLTETFFNGGGTRPPPHLKITMVSLSPRANP
jgi:hypothetical protein